MRALLLRLGQRQSRGFLLVMVQAAPQLQQDLVQHANVQHVLILKGWLAYVRCGIGVDSLRFLFFLHFPF